VSVVVMVVGQVQLMFSGGCVAERERVRVFAELETICVCVLSDTLVCSCSFLLNGGALW